MLGGGPLKGGAIRGGRMGAGEGAGAHEGEEVFELGEEGGDAAEDEVGQEYRQDVIHQDPHPGGRG